MRRRNKSNLPLPVLSYKYFLLGYSFSIASFYSPNSAFLATATIREFQELQQELPPTTPKSSIFFPTGQWPSTLSSLRLAYPPSFLYSCCTFIHPQSVLPNPSSFCSSFHLKSLGFGRQDRDPYRSTPSPMPWSTRKLRPHRSYKRRDKQNPL